MASTRWSIEHDGHLIEVEPESKWGPAVVRLFVDGEEVASTTGRKRVTVGADAGPEVRTWLSWHEGSFTRAELVLADGGTLPLDPPPGTFAARMEAFGRRHPVLYSARHAFGGAGKVLLGFIGIGFLLRLLPDISIDLPLPDIDLPLPEIPWPQIDLPDITAPAWVEAIANSAKYWGPILVGIGYAAVEYRRRKRQRPVSPVIPSGHGHDAPPHRRGDPGAA